ncbi:hypothetical protein [Pseudomonas mucidolens]|uniref:hypothetical protein n=1 Tax=Pseudomonas mucidolens TaxID=46679 RepID=UPI0030DD4390
MMTASTFILILLFVMPFVCLGLKLFVDYRKLDELERYFRGNEAVQRNKRFWGRNQVIDRTMRMSILIGFFMQPRTHVKNNDVTWKELNSVPLALKRWVLWPFYLSLMYGLAVTVWVAGTVRNFVFGHNMLKRCMYANQKEDGLGGQNRASFDPEGAD